jgi:hypothetical protein
MSGRFHPLTTKLRPIVVCFCAGVQSAGDVRCVYAEQNISA